MFFSCHIKNINSTLKTQKLKNFAEDYVSQIKKKLRKSSPKFSFVFDSFFISVGFLVFILILSRQWNLKYFPSIVEQNYKKQMDAGEKNSFGRRNQCVVCLQYKELIHLLFWAFEELIYMNVSKI